ncbi:MAG: peptidylprolyl isomerase [Chloroflexi bacterium]|nr:peptidylprolyl isomerase [Chloroflexota bacterium]
MVKSKKRGTDKIDKKEEAPQAAAFVITRRTLITVVSVIVAIMLIIIGGVYYQTSVAPFRRAIIKIDNVPITMDYLIKRARVSGSEPMSMIESLSNELLIRIAAPQLGIDLTPQELDKELRILASGGTENMTDQEFKEWYRQRLNESKLSDSEYKEIVRTGILGTRLQEYLATKVPTVAEQVHLNAMVLDTYDNAQKARARIKAGETFANVVKEVSLDEQSKQDGGDAGWLPRGVMDSSLESVIFNLKVGEVSEATPYSQDPSSGVSVYYLFMISEKANREVAPEFMEVLKGSALQRWLAEEKQYHDIQYNFDSEIYAWLNYQLAKYKTDEGEQQQ